MPLAPAKLPVDCVVPMSNPDEIQNVHKDKGGFVERLNVEQIIFGTAFALSGYLVAFFFEFGYFSYFDIPFYLIDINVTLIIIPYIFVLLSILMFIYYMNTVNVVVFFSDYIPRLARLFIKTTLFLIISIVGIFLLILLSPKELIWVLAANFISITIFYLFPFGRTNIHSFDFGLKKYQEEFGDRDPVVSILGRRVCLLVVLLVIICSLSFSAGRSGALFERKVYLVQNATYEVVLRIYLDRYIAVPYSDVGSNKISQIIVQPTSGAVFIEKSIDDLNIGRKHTIYHSILRSAFIVRLYLKYL